MRKSSQGFTLLEMLVALAIGAVVLLALFFTLNSAIHTVVRVREIQERVWDEQKVDEAINRAFSFGILAINYRREPFDLVVDSQDYKDHFFWENGSLLQKTYFKKQKITKNTLRATCQSITILFITEKGDTITLNQLTPKEAQAYKGIQFILEKENYKLVKTKLFST